MAKLYFRYGAMNCGKTALLLQAVHNYEARGMKVLVLKPIVDSKGGKTIVSRIGLKREVDHLIKNTEDMFKYLSKNIINISCIFIDEAQFLKRKQVDDLLRVVVTYDIPLNEIVDKIKTIIKNTFNPDTFFSAFAFWLINLPPNYFSNL